MSDEPRALVVRTAGTNCDTELVRAFELGGARAERLHIRALIDKPSLLDRFDLVGFPGGFSYGDDVASGRILAMQARERLYPSLRAAADRGVAMIGVCNGFQVMVQIGLLPGPAEGRAWPEQRAPAPRVALVENSPPRFVDRWVGVEADAGSRCVWTTGLAAFADEHHTMLPVAHGEGRFVPEDDATLSALAGSGQVALRYRDNPNGSTGDVAGICDLSGRIFGLMPHPERYLDWNRHPYRTRLLTGDLPSETPGLAMFRGAIDALRTQSV
ncbi:MAG: phosphoribosylformylglycinamidine synthase subunit PurQ [Planctomycetota bacterium]